MTRCVHIFIFTILCSLISLAANASPRIAIMDFENRAQYGDWRIGRGAADILTTELVKNTDYEVFERERLNAVMQEQNLGNGARFDNSTAAKIGKLIGVQYIVTGAVTEYGESRSGGGGGGINVGKKGYYASVDVRIVDVNTGRILFAEKGDGKKSSVNVRVMGFGGGERGNQKNATEALRNAITDVAGKLAKADLSTGPVGPVETLVADVDGSVITLNQGSGAGFASGDVLTVKRQGKVIKDPATGSVIKVKYKTIGKIKLTEVETAYSEGVVVSGTGFMNGDKAEK